MTNSKKNILITGASGLIGSRLTELLAQRGDSVRHLSRSKRSSGIPSFVWDVERQTADVDAFKTIDTIVHLAGAGIADERWTAKRKIEILQSRTKSTQLLYDTLQRINHSVTTFISASAIGYYGFEGFEEFTEQSQPGRDFLAKVTYQWEQSVDRLNALGVRIVKLRTGIVLSDRGGVLKEMGTPVKFYVGAPLGSGNQYISWIHIDDLCGMFIKAIDDENMKGVYNAVAPNPVTNRELTNAIGKVLHRPVFLPPIPSFVLKLILGEMADIVVKGSKVSPAKIIQAGYQFKFTSMEKAVSDLLAK